MYDFHDRKITIKEDQQWSYEIVGLMILSQHSFKSESTALVARPKNEVFHFTHILMGKKKL